MGSRSRNPKITAHPAEGLSAFKEELFDMVLTDFGLPGMNGEEVARTVHRTSPNTPIILLDNRGIRGFLHEPKLKSPYHLLEGHRRLSFLQGLKRLGKARDRHSVWITRRPARRWSFPSIPGFSQLRNG